MTPEQTLALSSRALEIAIYMAGPLLLVALVIGLIVSIFQAATQINEATLSFIPKLLKNAVKRLLKLFLKSSS